MEGKDGLSREFVTPHQLPGGFKAQIHDPGQVKEDGDLDEGMKRRDLGEIWEFKSKQDSVVD